MWGTYIYTAFYVTLHCVFLIFEWVYGALDYVNKIVDFCHEFLLKTEKNKQLQRQISEITKTPAHLTVILGPEQPSYKDLANLVVWCLGTRISFISFYDHKGTLKKNEQELEYEVQKRKSREDHIIWHIGLDSTYKNGFVGRKVHVKIITEEDGKASVVNLIKNRMLTKNRNFSLDSISQDLHKQFEFPDPDLGLVCGKTFNLHNYPPWQIRVTEFLTLRSHHNITFSAFIELLLRYSKCEQRMGK